jgi:hypothetical protein
MFGLEDQSKKKKTDPFIFDLEKELGDAKSRGQIKLKTEKAIQKIKELLRNGEDKEEFDKLGILLQGYNSLLKVISRVPTKV